MNPNDALSQAQNPTTPPTLLADLGNHGHVSVRLAVAEHPHTPPEVRQQLSRDPEWSVRHHLLMHPDLEQSVLEQLSQDPHPSVREHAEELLRYQARQSWSDADATRALEDAKSGDLIALEQVGLYLLEQELADRPGSSYFVVRVILPGGNTGPDRLREAVSYLTTAAEYGRYQARAHLDALSLEQDYSRPATRGHLWVDPSYRFGPDELLPSRSEVRLKGSLVEGFNYANPSITAAWLESMGFAWSDPASIAQHFNTWADDEEGALEALREWVEEPSQETEPLLASQDAQHEDMLDPSSELEDDEAEARGDSLVQAALRYDLQTGWQVIEQLSEQAQDDEYAALLCLALLRLYSGIGHARSSVTFRALVQLKAEYEQGGS